jgi:hypothetical protein
LKGEAGPVRLEVLSPLSKFAITKENAARVDSLQGKTICEVWETGDYGGDRTFPVLRELLQKRFPDAKFVPYTDFPIGQRYPDPRWVPHDKVAETLKAKGCDAVLLGNGG